METNAGVEVARGERHLIEIIVGPCSRLYVDGVATEIQALMDERWPSLGCAVGVRYGPIATS